MTTFEFESSINNARVTLHPIALQLTRDVEDAKDLLQVTFMKAWANKDRFNPGTNIKAWLYTIMKNTFVSEYNKKKRQKTYLDRTDNQYFLNSSDHARTPEEADSAMNLDEILLAIDELPEAYRMPFKSFVEGYKFEVISANLDLPLGSV